MKQKLAIAAFAALAATPAAAQPILVDPPQVERVSYDGLNLASSAGRLELQGRIRAAAYRVCEVDGMWRLEEFGLFTRCARGAIQDGFRQMDALIASNRADSAIVASVLIISPK
jgi:UrcA family protein